MVMPMVVAAMMVAIVVTAVFVAVAVTGMTVVVMTIPVFITVAMITVIAPVTMIPGLRLWRKRGERKNGGKGNGDGFDIHNYSPNSDAVRAEVFTIRSNFFAGRNRITQPFTPVIIRIREASPESFARSPPRSQVCTGNADLREIELCSN